MKKSGDLISIIYGCKENNPEAQGALYKLYAPQGRKICTRYLHNLSDAEEIVQDGLVKVFSNIKFFDPSRPFNPWFKQLMIHTVIDHLRKNHTQIKTQSLFPDAPFSKKPKAISTAYYNDLLKLVNMLPASYKATFILYHIEGYSHVEIAEKLNITPATSRSNLVKARKKLLGWLNRAQDVK